MAHLIDILLPVFNGASTIGEAVASLQRQTVTNFRIIIIDDGSTDQTPQILSNLAQRDKRISIVRKPNGGIIDALNTGLSLCDAEFVARQDADDISFPSRLASQIAYLESHPHCVAVSGAMVHIDEHGQPLGSIQRLPQPELCDPYWAPSREPYLMHPFLMARRAELAAVGGYRYAYYAEDTDLYWRLRERGSLHNLAELVGHYRRHARSVSSESIVNGRIMALNSQLAGLSACRRMEGRPDISFRKEAIVEYREAHNLAALCKLASAQLDKTERRYLGVAVAGKLLELAAYRPYELDTNDCRFIRDTLKKTTWLQRLNRRELARMQSAAGTRLLRNKRLREAAVLTPPKLYLGALARLAAASLPEPISRFFRQAQRWAFH